MARNYNDAEFRKLFVASGLPELGPGRREQALPQKEVDAQLGKLFANTDLTPDARNLVRALVLLWHDHLDAAHEIAQGIENADGSFVHGIVHRREPDYGNARYWFRRVGKHEAFPEIGKLTSVFLTMPQEAPMLVQLVRNGDWNPVAFIELCEQAGRGPASDSQSAVLRVIQFLEFKALLDHFLRSAPTAGI